MRCGIRNVGNLPGNETFYPVQMQGDMRKDI